MHGAKLPSSVPSRTPRRCREADCCRIFFVTAEELAGSPCRRRVPLRMAGELLEARNLALIAFDGTDAVPPHSR